jgi:serine/threonine-protein kinase RsbW
MSALARGPEPLTLRLAAPSLPARLSQVRVQVAEWAQGIGLGSDTVDDLVLAAHEALANVADHAYPDGGGTALLDADCCDGEARVVVRDHGRWRPPPTDPGWRGRGLKIINGLADRVDVDQQETGTSVTMRWRLPG